MKKILLMLILVGNVAFGLPTQQVEDHLNTLWSYHRVGRVKKAIAECTRLIEDETVVRVDKVHYLVARSTFHLAADDQDGYEVDIDVIRYLFDNYGECADEIFTWYDCSFYHFDA